MANRQTLWVGLIIAFLLGYSVPAWAASSGSTQPSAITTLPAYYGFTKTVTLTNQGRNPALNVKTKIVLSAPKNAYAHVTLSGYSQEPSSTYRDANGNLIGVYTWSSLKPKKSVTITLHYQATSSDISYRLPHSYPHYNTSSALYQRYTNPGWEASKINTDAPPIKAKVDQLVRGLTNPYQRAQVLFHWVAYHIRYNYKLKASGSALKTFQTRLGICSDIADLYVSMLRTDGIPARLISGYVTNNGTGHGGFHQWVQFYLPRVGWVVADPTWGRYGYFAGLEDDWHIPLYDGIRPDISVHWQYANHTASNAPYLAIHYHYHFVTEQSSPQAHHVKLPLVSVTPPVSSHHNALAVAQSSLQSEWHGLVAFFHQYIIRLKIVLASL